MTVQRSNARRWQISLILMSLLAITPACAHHQSASGGPIRGVAIPAISHGEMPVVARYRSDVLALASRQPVTDPTLRRLTGYIGLQRFACFWGLVPGSLADEASPFNECSHATLAGVKALLAHMADMPGDQSAAKTLQASMDAEIANDPAASAICSNSNQTFDSADIIGPDWQLGLTHPPTILTFAAAFGLIFAGLAAATRRRLVSGTASAAS